MVRKRICIASLVLLAGVGLLSPGAAEAQRRGSQRGGGSYENGNYENGNSDNQRYGYQANSVNGADQVVRVQVRLPAADAKVWFENQQTKQNGMARDFESPPLESGYTYRYTIRARWQENGRTMEQTRSLKVRAGETKLVDFTQAAVAGTEQASNGNNRSVKASGSAHYGKIVSVTGNELVMTGKNGKQHSHTVAANAKVTCDGTPCRFADLEPGLRIRVTTSSKDPARVTRIEALKENQAFEKSSNNAGRTSHDGKVVSVAGNKLVMTGKNGKEHSHIVAANAKVSCDGAVCRFADLEAGWRIRVTIRENDNAVARIEALKNNESFKNRN